MKKSEKIDKQMAPDHWYLVEVSLFKGNPQHRAIAEVHSVDEVDLYGYNNVLRRNINQLHHFKIIEELTWMRPRDRFIPGSVYLENKQET
mgnify:CR=1 FL=1